SAVAGSVATNTASTPTPRRERRPPPSAIHQNSVALATKLTCSRAWTEPSRSVASYNAGRCHSASVNVARTNEPAVHTNQPRRELCDRSTRRDAAWTWRDQRGGRAFE